jgi:putative ABC transport system permease protein
VAGTVFTVIGLLERQGSSFGRSLDNPVYIPITAYYDMYGGQRGTAVFGKARAESGLSMNGALDVTREALRSHFHTPVGQADNFDTLTPDSVRSFVDSVLGVIAAVVVPITSISLVVGGIGVMNIMLVSVTERTREIGVRKAIGARRRDIVLQFLSEAVALTGAGGLVSAIFPSLRCKVPGWAVITAFSVSVAVGLFFGVWPAVTASRLDPVEALRYE